MTVLDQVRPTTPSHRMTIARLTEIYGTSRRTIRYYEGIGLLRPRRLGRDLLYSAKDEVRLQIVLTGRRLGLSLSQIVQLIEQPGCCVRTDEMEEPPISKRREGSRPIALMREGNGHPAATAMRE